MTSSYRELRGSACVPKDVNNQLIVDLAREHIPRSSTIEALVLDGPCIRTSRALLHGLGRRHVRCIHAPQMDAKDCRIMRARASREIGGHVLRIHGSTMWKFLHTGAIRRGSISVAYFDFMSTVTGSQTRTDGLPLEDMHRFLGFHASRTRLVLGCTFSVRMTKDTRSASCESHIVQDYLRPLFQYHQYAVLQQHSRTYRRGGMGTCMVFAAFVLQKDEAIQPSTAKFVLTADGQHYEGYSRAWRADGSTAAQGLVE
jgi:hypothetical protein